MPSFLLDNDSNLAAMQQHYLPDLIIFFVFLMSQDNHNQFKKWKMIISNISMKSSADTLIRNRKAYIINFSINNMFDMWYKLCFALGELWLSRYIMRYCLNSIMHMWKWLLPKSIWVWSVWIEKIVIFVLFHLFMILIYNR